MFKVHDAALCEIEDQVMAFPPERGGALLGPRGASVITEFLIDDDAQTTSASFVPSLGLTQRVRCVEQDCDLELKGVLHNHPGSLDRLSGPDVYAVERGLDANPHLASYLCPIGTALSPTEPAPHETIVGGGKLSWYVGQRKRGGGATIAKVRCQTLPIARDTAAVARSFGVDSVNDLGAVEIQGNSMWAREITVGDNTQVLLMFGASYPLLPPIVMVGFGDRTEQLHFDWSVEQDSLEQLVTGIAHQFVAKRTGLPFRRAWTVGPGGPLTLKEEVGAYAGWRPVFTDVDPPAIARETRDAALARTRGILPDSMAGNRVLIVGCGSVGSYVAEQFTRSGLDFLHLVDPDAVELANLSRSCYVLEDERRFKVDALKQHLLNINPLVSVECARSALQEMKVDAVEIAIHAADLVVGALDDPQGMRVLNRFAYAQGTPGVWIGLYERAWGGEVVITKPGETPCYQCATNFRRSMEQEAGRVSPQTDYGTGRLAGEPALGVDVHHVASVAVKLGLSLLMPEDDDGVLHNMASGAVRDGNNYALMGTVPNYWFFPQVFGETAGQYAYQSVWAAASSDATCPVCGDEAYRVDHRTVPLVAPSVADVRSALVAGQAKSVRGTADNGVDAKGATVSRQALEQ